MDLFGESWEPRGMSRLRNYLVFPSIDSTNDLACGLVDYAEEEEFRLVPSVIVSARQSAGRGRRGRTWVSPEGGLYASFVFAAPPEVPLTLWPLAGAIWAAEAVESLGAAVRLKWPNDVVCGRKKLAGILTEVKTRGEETHVVLGIGANLGGSADRYGDEGATSVEAETGRPPSRRAYLVEICRRFDAFLSGAEEPGTVVPRWEARAIHARGEPLSVIVEEEGRSIERRGAYAGLTAEGFLRLEAEGSLQVITGGEIRRW